jgi:hypothetical protein
MKPGIQEDMWQGAICMTLPLHFHFNTVNILRLSESEKKNVKMADMS